MTEIFADSDFGNVLSCCFLLVAYDKKFEKFEFNFILVCPKKC